MDSLAKILDTIDGYIWGAPLLVALMLIGIFLTYKLRLIQVSNLVFSLKLVFKKSNESDESKQGEITGFAALVLVIS